MLFYSSLCEEGPQYGNKLIEKFGVCGFLDKILCDVKVDSRSYFPLSCLVGEMFIGQAVILLVLLLNDHV